MSDVEERRPDWACPDCDGYGIQGGWDGTGFADWVCTTCGGSGVKPGVTPPWEQEGPLS